MKRFFLIAILLCLSCSPAFAQVGETVADVGDGWVSAGGQVSLIASRTAAANFPTTATPGQVTGIVANAGSDLYGEWDDSATFTAAVYQKMRVELNAQIDAPGSGQSANFGIIKNSTVLNGATSPVLAAASDSGVYVSGSGIIELNKGDTFGIWAADTNNGNVVELTLTITRIK